MPFILLLKLTTMMMGQTNNILPYFCLIKRLFSCFHENVGHTRMSKGRNASLITIISKKISGKLQCSYLILLIDHIKRKKLRRSFACFYIEVGIYNQSFACWITYEFCRRIQPHTVHLEWLFGQQEECHGVQPDKSLYLDFLFHLEPPRPGFDFSRVLP